MALSHDQIDSLSVRGQYEATDEVKASIEGSKFILSLLPAEWRESAQITGPSDGAIGVEWHREGH